MNKIMKKKRKVRFLASFLLGCFLGYSIHNYVRKNAINSMKMTHEYISYQSVEGMIRRGNEYAFIDYFHTYPEDNKIEDFFICDLIMVNKYNKIENCKDMVSELLYYYWFDFSKPPLVVLSIGLDYLNLGADNGNRECFEQLKYMYSEGVFVEKDSVRSAWYKEAENSFLKEKYKYLREGLYNF